MNAMEMKRDAKDAVWDAKIDAMEIKRDAKDAARDAIIDAKFDRLFEAISAYSDSLYYLNGKIDVLEQRLK